MSDRLAEIRARLDAATPGPDGRLRRVQPTPQPWGPPLTYEVDKPDADFIAHAHTDIAWLLDRVRDLEAGIVTACQIGVRGTTGQEAQALASLMHDLNVPGVDDA